MKDQTLKPGYYWVKLIKWDNFRLCRLRDPNIYRIFPFVVTDSPESTFDWDPIEYISGRIEPPKI